MVAGRYLVTWCSIQELFFRSGEAQYTPANESIGVVVISVAFGSR
jgi:hypothetical protein